MSTPVRQQDREAILRAVRAGVVPPRGLQHLQVGRADEIEALAADIRTVKKGNAAFRILVGDYGSGKSFFLQVIRQAAHRAGCVTMKADVGQDMRLYGTGGKVRALYSNLVGSAGTTSHPGGGAMAEVLERLIDSATQESHRRGGDIEDVIRGRLVDLDRMPGGPRFVDVVLAYWEGMRDGDNGRREGALRWLRGEYHAAGEAKQTLGVKGIVGDADLYPMLCLLAMLISKAGYGGLVVELDELGVLGRLNKPTRDQNYEQILTMFNSLLTGHRQHIMVVLAGPPDFVRDPTRGLYSYPALRERLSLNRFHRPGLRDDAALVIGLEPLADEHVWVLLENLHRVHCSNGNHDPLPDLQTAIGAFLDHMKRQIPGHHLRRVAQSWLQFLDLLSQNRREHWRNLLDGIVVLAEVARVDTADQPDEESAVLVSTGVATAH